MQNVNDGFFAAVLIGMYAIAALGYALWHLRLQQQAYQLNTRLWDNLVEKKNAEISKLDNQVARYKKVNGGLKRSIASLQGWCGHYRRELKEFEEVSLEDWSYYEQLDASLTEPQK